MRKKITRGVLGILMLLLLGVQVWAARDFAGNPDRAEVFGVTAEQMELLSGQYRTEFSPEKGCGAVFDNGKPFFRQKLAEALGPEAAVRYVSGNKVLEQFPKLTLWLWGCLVLLAFGCIMVYSVKKAAALYRSEQGECYFGQWVEKHMVGLLMGAIGWCVMLVAGLFLLRWLLSFQFFLPGDLLPPDFILDFPFYKEQLAALSALPRTAYWGDLGSHFLWAFLAFLAGIPLDILAAGVCWKKACQ